MSASNARTIAAACFGRARLVAAVLAAAAAACGDDLPSGQGESSSSTTSLTGITGTTGDPASTSTVAPASSDEGAGTSTTGPSTVGIPDECTASAHCADGELCVAPFDQSAGPEGKGAYACVSECVVIMDEDRWCADKAACCDPSAECTDRGYCVEPDGSTGSSEGSGSSGGSSESGTTG